MSARSFVARDSRAGLTCEAECETHGQNLTMTLTGREGVFAVSEYSMAFDFELPYLKRQIHRFRQRIDSRERCRTLETRRWPCRPYQWMKRNCLFLGSLRGHANCRPHREHTRKRLFSLALVPRKDVAVIEVCIDDLDWNTIHLPVEFIAKLQLLLDGPITEIESTG